LGTWGKRHSREEKNIRGGGGKGGKPGALWWGMICIVSSLCSGKGQKNKKGERESIKGVGGRDIFTLLEKL